MRFLASWRQRVWRGVGTLLFGVSSLLGLTALLGQPNAADTHVVVRTRLIEPARSEVVATTAITYRQLLPLVARYFHDSIPPFGIQTYWPISAQYGLTQVIEAKAAWVRFPVAWSAIEPTNVSPTQYHWTDMDSSVSAAQNAGIRLIGTLVSNPAWATSSGKVEAGGPVKNNADLQEFVSALATRYPYIKYWELYNEPDGYFRLNGAGYAAVLEAVYPVIKAANPEAQVVLGGLALDWFIDEGGPFDREFLPTVLQNCSGPCFDIANFHYYPAFRYRWEPYGRDILGKANYVRQVLGTYHYARPVINTETGWPNIVSWGGPEVAARWVPKVFARGMAAKLPVVIWYALLDADSSVPGLLNPDLTPRRVYTAFHTLTNLMSTARFVRAIPEIQTGSSLIEGYEFSVWTAYGSKRLDIYWYDCPSMSDYPLPYDCGDAASLKIPAARLGVIDNQGTRTVVVDAADGVQDGFVTFNVLSSPIYIDYRP